MLLLVFWYVFGGFGRNIAAMREYAALLNKIDETYIGEYDPSEVAASALRAAVDALDDRWSYYMTPDEFAQYLNETNNQFAGIGVGVAANSEKGGMEIMSVYAGSPAEKAGISVGDIITEVDGKSVEGLDVDDLRLMLARKIGDTASLTLLRTDGSVEAVAVAYELVFTDPVSFRMLENNIGYVRIVNFERGASEGFIAAVEDLIGQGAKSFIYDVRCNRGGRVIEMTDILDFLLPEGEIFISVDKSGKEEITTSDASMVDMPAIVLVDRHSYSAAEYFAATLSEYNYAITVGEQTTGKSRSQRTEILPGGGALHISTSQYLTKNRVALFDAGGFTPDYQLSLSDEELSMLLSGNLDMADDAQLQLAIELS
ncbi:MAG: S41 family peptidase [Oscillospiraceae bacterium]|nr:S41 family peptidase [Oscillospiraceae bacterium]